MILNTRAEYDPHTDSVQVAIVVQNDDASSASDAVVSGDISILSFDEVMFSLQFSRKNKVLWVEDDGSVTDDGQFYAFLLHPPIQRNMSVRTYITLADGTKLEDYTDVRVHEEIDTETWQNKAFSGKITEPYEPDLNIP